MKFTEGHKEVLERYREHWNTLQTAGFMRNLDRPVFDQLQAIHNEALGPAQSTHWCAACVADMVRILYTNYDKWLSAQCSVTIGTVTAAATAVKYGGRGQGRGRRNKRR